MTARCWRCDSDTPNPACSDLLCPVLDNASAELRTSDPLPKPTQVADDAADAAFLERLAVGQELERMAALVDPIKHPPHYTRGGIEFCDVVEALELGHHLGAALGYIWRCDHKGGPEKALEDLRKARWYLDREIARRERAKGG